MRVVGARVDGAAVVHIGLAEHDTAGGTHAGDDRGVAFGDKRSGAPRTGRADEAFGFDPVLHRERDAVQRAEGVATSNGVISAAGRSERGIGVDLDDGVDLRVDLGDALEVGGDGLG